MTMDTNDLILALFTEGARSNLDGDLCRRLMRDAARRLENYQGKLTACATLIICIDDSQEIREGILDSVRVAEPGR